MSRSRFASWLVVVVAVAATVLTGGPAQAAGHPVQRSGTVLNPAGYTGPGTCTAAADCLLFLASGCDARFAGQEPAAFASIVDVRSLRGTKRTVTASGSLGAHLISTYYEFWAKDCSRVGYVLVGSRTVLTIPRDAQWMTVPGQIGPYHWAMR